MTKIYVLDLLYKERGNGVEFLENQIHFISKEKAIQYGEEWLEKQKQGIFHPSCMKAIISISWCEVEDFDITELENTGFIENAEYDYNNVLYEKEYLIKEYL